MRFGSRGPRKFLREDAVEGLGKCESKAKVIRRPCDSTSGNLNKTSVREKSRSVYQAIG